MAEYTYKQLGIPLDLNNWESLNDNFKKIARDLNNLSGDVLASVIDGAKLIWQEPVDTFADLATTYPDAEEGWTVFVRNSGVNGETYRYDGSSWLKIQDFDATAINEVDNRLTSQLADTAAEVETAGIANALTPLYIPTYDGSNQTTHPKVLKLATAFGGWRWWMAHTPYPAGDDDYENPSVSYSADGVTWYSISGNPIDKPTPEETAAGGFMSDGHIVMVGSTMELWYRYATNSDDVKIFRKTSTDGVTWTARELMIDCAITGERVVAPALLFENNLYKMWFINQDRDIVYQESADGLTWVNRRVLNVPKTIDGHTAWHLDVTKTSKGYEFVCNYTQSTSGILYYFMSTDNVTFTTPVKIISPSKDPLAWDGAMIYRASLVDDNGKYKIYYSAVGNDGRWFIGLSSGDDVEHLKGSSNYQFLGMKNDVSLQYSLFLQSSRALGIGDARYRQNKLEFKSGSSGASVELSSADEISFRNGAGTGFANIKANKLTLSNDLVTPTNVDARKAIVDYIQMDLGLTGLSSTEGLIQYDAVANILSFHDGVQAYHLNNYIRTIPASNTATGVRGSWSADTNYLYICHNTNQWIRIAKDGAW